LSIKPGN